MGTVVVTGATGTVGRWVADELRARGTSVRTLRRDPVDEPDSVRVSFTEPATWPAAFAGASALF